MGKLAEMKECIVILGMHRSGTSVLTGLLNILGCYPGADMMLPAKDNPKGFFENIKIHNLNEKILYENDSAWDDSLFSADQISLKNKQEYVQQAKNIILEELKYANKIIIKDPRICILFSIWEEALTTLNIKIKTIILYRSPMEVALSLKQRNDMPIEQGLLLWSQYFFQSEQTSRQTKRLFIEYSNDFVELNKLLILLANFTDLELTEAHRKQAHEFYTPSLKHQTLPLSNISLNLPNYLICLVNLLVNHNINDNPSIDKLHNEFIQSQHFFLHNVKKLNKAISNEKTINNEQEKLNNIQKKLNSTQKKEIDTLQQQLDEQQVKIQHQQADLDKQHIRITTQQKVEDSQQVRINHQQTHLDGLYQQITNQQIKQEAHQIKINRQQDSLDEQQRGILNLQEIKEQQLITLNHQQSNIDTLQAELKTQQVMVKEQHKDLLSLQNKLEDEKEKYLSASTHWNNKEATIQQNNEQSLQEKHQQISRLEIDNNQLINSHKSLQTILADRKSFKKLKSSLNNNYFKQKLGTALQMFEENKSKKIFTDKALILKSGLFSPAYYLSTYADIRESNVDPLTHYCKSGWKEGRQPAADFNVGTYLEQYPDLINAGINPLLHFIKKGAENPTKQNKQADETHEAFDEIFYLTTYSDVKENGIDPYSHFMEYGWKEGRDPSTSFSTSYYLKCNPDVAYAGINPLKHYITSGRHEQRSTNLEQPRKITASITSPSILFVGHSAAQGGAEVVLLDIIRWYAENTTYQINTLLLAPGPLASECLRYGDILVLNDAKELASEKTRDFLDFYYDLIYLNTVVTGSFAKIYHQLYAKHQIPIILHVHEMSKVIETYKEEFNHIEQHVDQFIAASSRVKVDLVDDYHIDPKRISVHHSFVQSKANNKTDLAQQVTTARNYFGLNNNDIVIMGSGTAYWRKGPDIFIETIRKVINQYRDKNIVAIWMGDGEDLEALKSQVKDANLTDKIRFTGFIKNSSELVAAADIFFLSSREDPFPLVCLEAAQFEIPIVCFEEATGMIELIQDDAGITVNKIDSSLATDAIIDLIKNEQKRELFGFTARSRFIQNYSSENQIRKIFLELKERYEFKPSLSVIIPNYNHEAYLKERIDSVIHQSFYDLEILLLDDSSTDHSLDIINTYQQDKRISVMTNRVGSGSPFKQWKKGVLLAKSDYIWVAESDDTCAENFVEILLQTFNDSQVVLSFCKSEIIDEKGTLVPDALTPYMERAHPTKFNTPYILDGNIEVEENFAVACTIVNASSAIFRKSAIEDAIEESMTYKMCGDWSLYLQALSQGKIAYSTQTVNFFRRHQASTVHAIEGTDTYFEERYNIAKTVINHFNVSEQTLKRMINEVDSEWERFKHIPKISTYEESFNKSKLIKRHKQHYVPPIKIGFYVHGFMFSKGGIERLAADLANYLVHRHHEVTIYCRIHSNNKPIYPIDKSIKVVPIFDEDHQEKTSQDLRKALSTSNIDVFVPMLSEWLFEPIIKAAEGLDFPIIASEHNCPAAIEDKWWNHTSRVNTLKKVDLIHLVREGFKTSLPQELQGKINVIPNGSSLSSLIKVDRKKTYHRILSAGRLAPQKRFDRLIKAFSIAAKSIDKDWVLDIYGEGPDREDLSELISSYGMENRIKLRGSTNQLEKEYLTSDIFVTSAEFEAGPIVVIEAQMFGVPCIGYNDCSGTNEAIRHNIDGLLAKPDENGSELARAIIKLVQNEELRIQFGKASKENSFLLNMKVVSEKWEKMLISLVSSD